MATLSLWRLLSILLLASPRISWAFVVVPWQHQSSFRSSTWRRLHDNTKNNNGQVGSGPNWLERSFPVDTDDSKSTLVGVHDYNLGLSGVSWQTGPLSARMYETMTSRSSALQQTTDLDTKQEILCTFKWLAMDLTAKEAVRAALKQNGLEMALADQDEQDADLWGDVMSIQLLDMETNQPIGPVYENWQDAANHWEPGQGFDFVVHQVPAKLRELSLEELLQALDPDRSLRQQAKEAGVTNLLPDTVECDSLEDMANENVRRTEQAPQEAVAESEAFAGTSARGYQVIAARDLALFPHQQEPDHDEPSFLLESKTVLHVMDALVSHGCLIVDVTNGGEDMEAAQRLAGMWKTTESFFATIDTNPDLEDSLPPMTTAAETGSPYAKVGYASYSDGDLQFLETRLTRGTTRNILPEQVQSILGPQGCQSLQQAFDLVASIGKNVVRIAVAASTLEAASESPDTIPAKFDALLATDRVAQELLDDGQSLASKLEGSNQRLVHTEGSVNMSPHRLCRYSNNKQPVSQKEDSTESKAFMNNTREIFGAHTDSSFVTMVPVAAVSGLEVYDEAAEKWYRPELAAKRHYHEATSDDDDDKLPWHARYVIVMPGELLQLLTRQEILAAVHRVVATSQSRRYSAPILLRGRSGTILDAARYWGQASTALLKECNGKTMEEIHNVMQPGSNDIQSEA